MWRNIQNIINLNIYKDKAIRQIKQAFRQIKAAVRAGKLAFEIFKMQFRVPKLSHPCWHVYKTTKGEVYNSL